MTITNLFGKKIIICDGAMGTMMQKYGLKAGELPESLNITHPEIIRGIHKEYFDAGSDFVSTNTFGANAYKLKGSGYTVDQIVNQAVKLAKEAALDTVSQGEKYVALDVAPIGRLLEPVGDLTFEEAYGMFREQIVAGTKAGADFILFETFTDISELKAGILAAKENCELPVFASVTFQEDGRMLMGSDPLTAVNIIQDLGIDALGVNCSLGPKQMVKLIKEFLKYSKLPVLVQPNAGLPVSVNGETIYDVDFAEYTEAMLEMLQAGVAVAGGCCGTTPAYIEELVSRIKQISDQYGADKIRDPEKTPFPALASDAEERRAEKAITAVSSATKTVILDDRIRIIGERINPTGKKLLKEALKSGDFAYIENEAINQVRAGAEILDINVGLPEIDEQEMMRKAIRKVSSVVQVPLQIDSADEAVIETAVRLYQGKPIINSVNGKKEVMEAIFPIVKKYGTCVIALTLDEKGLPKNTQERLDIAERIIKTAATYGIGKERILVDCLTLTVSAQQSAGKDTLEAIRQVKSRFGVKTTLGASNVSFGLPERKLLNRTFLAMALEAGLDAPITDPTIEEYTDTIRAFETLSGKDIESKDYIVFYGNKSTGSGTQSSGMVPSGSNGNGTKADAGENGTKAGFSLSALTLEEIIIEGYEDRAAAAAQELLKIMKPLEIVETKIIPALEIVGKDYENGTSFLPQLIKSADTVKSAFVILKEAMNASGQSISYGKVILATVQGDIHDIGKNIVKVILENYGYDVIDLGKDVPIGTIVETAKKENIKMVGLSALMTTTVVNMEKTIKALKEAGLECITAVGGAVLNAEYAEKIGADYYCKDAMDTVRVANSIFKA
ncbi:homocysteine S-methyltransferase family protein [Sinanaerobacter chloroacetimidivorans]|uniref:Methionine synthase n=1 Tax=Sinanaerobacter chloroacetimidivorans TaxID=2818044 RepID=A0A8J8B447_9FIRM|nr:homocysteine S-methyltransferase family protein [Sinanaerobacter chloroacetimidivorans]MBR0600416.1 homocysteine S-methyltransferase family protein [Sinanaerobacter chloroacetimidivorans]